MRNKPVAGPPRENPLTEVVKAHDKWMGELLGESPAEHLAGLEGGRRRHKAPSLIQDVLQREQVRQLEKEGGMGNKTAP